jgi:hypothetical protein
MKPDAYIEYTCGLNPVLAHKLVTLEDVKDQKLKYN